MDRAGAGILNKGLAATTNALQPANAIRCATAWWGFEALWSSSGGTALRSSFPLHEQPLTTVSQPSEANKGRQTGKGAKPGGAD